MISLTQDNYFGQKASADYMSVSQFKDFAKCPASAMAKLRGEYVPERGRALLLGSYVDEILTGTKETQEAFLAERRDELFKKNGEPYADVARANETIERIREQPLMTHYLDGEHQTIMTGKIGGVPFKVKMDTYKKGEFISDLKYMASLRSPNLFEPMIRYWMYDIQAAAYQEIVRQNTGETLPFYFVVATKEEPAHLAVGQISQWNIDEAMERLLGSIGRFQQIKEGREPADRCEDYNCEYCTATKILTEPIDTDLFGMSAAQIRTMKGEL